MNDKLMNYDCPVCGKLMIIVTDDLGYSYQCVIPECVICETFDYFRPQTIEALSKKMAGLVLDADIAREENKRLRMVLEDIKKTFDECELLFDNLQTGYDESKSIKARSYFDKTDSTNCLLGDNCSKNCPCADWVSKNISPAPAKMCRWEFVKSSKNSIDNFPVYYYKTGCGEKLLFGKEYRDHMKYCYGCGLPIEEVAEETT